MPQGDVSGFGWDSGGNLLLGELGQLLRVGRDGGNSSQILSDAASQILETAGCGSRNLVFSWRFHGGTQTKNIWRANADGSNPVKLTDVT